MKKTRLHRANALFVKFNFQEAVRRTSSCLLLLCKIQIIKEHEKTRLNRADALFVEFTCNDYILISQVKGQAA
jgi:hypothetical protein